MIVISYYQKLNENPAGSRSGRYNTIYNKNLEIRYIDKTDNKGFSTGTKVELRIPIFFE